MVSLGRKINKSFKKIGAKEVARGLKTGAKVAGLGATAATLAGQPEIAVPLGAASLLMEGGAEIASDLEK